MGAVLLQWSKLPNSLFKVSNFLLNAAPSSRQIPNEMRKWDSHREISSLFELNHLLQLCSNSKALDQGRQVHQQINVHGWVQNPFMITKLVQMYADCEDLISAHKLFDKLSQPNVFSWTAILAFYSRNGMSYNCIRMYKEMKLKCIIPDKYVFPKVLKASAQSLFLVAGTQVHKDVIVCGAELNLQVCNSLIDMYSKCGNVENARQVFDEMVERDLLSWNSMISGYVCNGFLKLALNILDSIRFEGLEPDLVTWNTLMDAYCRMGQCDEAWKIFEQIKEPNIISWTTLISGYSRIEKHEVTLGIFRNMTSRLQVFPDLDCLASVIVSCRHLGALIHGKEIHAYGIKIETGFALYKWVGPALLTMYARCRRVEDARHVFDLMDKSDVVTWNSMILGFSDLGMENFALECFKKMQISGIQNDQTTLSTVLPLCELKPGEQVHAHITKTSFSSVIPVKNALIHMYSKCGCIGTAHSLFSNMVNRDRDIVSWNTMIGGFGMNGFGQAALQLFDELNHCGFSPNSVTFISVLSACSHSGLVNEGLELFHRMKRDFGFNPRMEHFACVVDLLGRAGRLEEAVGFITKMPIEPDKCIWGSLLAASKAHHSLNVGILASEHLVQLEPENAGHYVTLSNIYAKEGRWVDSTRVRRLMESRGLVKPSGYSWIERVK